MPTRISRGGYLYSPTVSNRTKNMQDYSFSYNEFGNVTGMEVGNCKLAEYEYDNSGLKLQLMRKLEFSMANVVPLIVGLIKGKVPNIEAKEHMKENMVYMY